MWFGVYVIEAGELRTQHASKRAQLFCSREKVLQDIQFYVEIKFGIDQI